MGRKHKLDEVLSALTKKGCVITSATPVTKRVKDFIMPNQDTIDKEFAKYLNEVGAEKIVRAINVVGTTGAAMVHYLSFQQSRPELFKAKEVSRTITIQDAYCVNVLPANGLGNKSWGKIDYLCNYCGYRVVRIKL